VTEKEYVLFIVIAIDRLLRIKENDKPTNCIQQKKYNSDM
jgi:hypothetical protein